MMNKIVNNNIIQEKNVHRLHIDLRIIVVQLLCYYYYVRIVQMLVVAVARAGVLLLLMRWRNFELVCVQHDVFIHRTVYYPRAARGYK
jgi:hypothetical protein